MVFWLVGQGLVGCYKWGGGVNDHNNLVNYCSSTKARAASPAPDGAQRQPAQAAVSPPSRRTGTRFPLSLSISRVPWPGPVFCSLGTVAVPWHFFFYSDPGPAARRRGLREGVGHCRWGPCVRGGCHPPVGHRQHFFRQSPSKKQARTGFSEVCSSKKRRISGGCQEFRWRTHFASDFFAFFAKISPRKCPIAFSVDLGSAHHASSHPRRRV